jgi:hypothetical protein
MRQHTTRLLFIALALVVLLCFIGQQQTVRATSTTDTRVLCGDRRCSASEKCFDIGGVQTCIPNDPAEKAKIQEVTRQAVHDFLKTQQGDSDRPLLEVLKDFATGLAPEQLPVDPEEEDEEEDAGNTPILDEVEKVLANENKPETERQEPVVVENETPTQNIAVLEPAQVDKNDVLEPAVLPAEKPTVVVEKPLSADPVIDEEQREVKREEEQRVTEDPAVVEDGQIPAEKPTSNIINEPEERENVAENEVPVNTER